MKPIHIVLLVILMAALGVVIATLTETGTYADFRQAAKNPGGEFHIIGKLSAGKPLMYDAMKDPNKFSFYMTDENGDEALIVYHGAKPQDFEKSEQVVIIGSMEGEVFEAKSLLLKCPSKYNENDKPEKFGKKQFGSGE
jgi:cytochrome c-type biogenesis protein CcmE